jgi:superfamily II DNA/RNA helicase
VAYGPQKGALRKGTDVLVATPGRLEDLTDQGCVHLGNVEIVVIDEADRMADMGFLPAVRRILDATDRERQTLLFSATLDGVVATLSRRYQDNPRRHEVAATAADVSSATHHFWLVAQDERVRHVADVVGVTGRSIVFTRTRRGADRLVRNMTKLGIDALALHGGRSQNQRSRAVQAFAAGRADALVATDVAARGIHIDAVASVIHFDPPADAKDYIHRSGRTARAGAGGTVISLVTDQQRRLVRRLQRDLDLDAPTETPQPDRLPRGDDLVPEPKHPKRQRKGDVPENGSPQRGPRRHTSAKSVYVANLPWSTTAEELEALFARHGQVSQTTIISDRRTGRSKGFGFVDMPAPSARGAIEALHGSTLKGRDLTVRLAHPRRYGA